MTSVRRIAALVVAGGSPRPRPCSRPLPALAHGAPTTAVSRTAACATGGEQTGTRGLPGGPRRPTAARSARFDNLRVPNVDGQDKQFIPDGNLCSGGLPDFQGLDLPRDDWPATKVTAGSTLNVRVPGHDPAPGHASGST